MAEGILKAIFDAKNSLNDLSPTHYGIPSFDLEREHYLYGRIDKEGDAIILDAGNFLRGIESAEGANNLVVDFVQEAFKSLKANYNKATRAGFLRSSVFYKNLKVYKSYPYGDLNTKYTNHMTLMYKNFVDKYLSKKRRSDKIKNFKDFIKEFLRYSLRICTYYPVTMTSFITSVHCSPFSSGLMLEVAPEQHGIMNSANLSKYFDDDYFNFWVKHVAKFGFMVDKNAPWRLIADVSSPKMKEFMSRYDSTLDENNFFKKYYVEAYVVDIEIMLKNIVSFYNNYVLSRPYVSKTFHAYSAGEVGSTKEKMKTKTRNKRRRKTSLKEIFRTYGIDDILNFYFTRFP